MCIKSFLNEQMNFPKFIKIFCFLCILSLQGCGKYQYIKSGSGFFSPILLSPTHEMYIDLEKKPECCAGFDQFPYQPIPIDSKITVYMDYKAPCYNFDSGKSYFKAFVLDGYPPYSVLIESYPSGHIFAPEVIILNNNYEVIKRVPFQYFKYSSEQEKSLTRLRVRYENKFKITEKESRYIVIYTTKEAQEYGLKRDLKGSILVVPAGGIFVPVPVGDPVFIHKNGPVGEVKIQVKEILE